jgi:hypothetical protein
MNTASGSVDHVANPISEQSLAEAVEGRDHWRLIGDQEAVYDPGEPAIVRVGRIAHPPRTGPTRTRHGRYSAAVVRDGRALHSAMLGTAYEAVRWAERQRLT